MGGRDENRDRTINFLFDCGTYDRWLLPEQDPCKDISLRGEAKRS